MRTLFILLIFLTTFSTWAANLTSTCNEQLQEPEEPQIIQELRQLKWNALNSKDRAEFLILNKAFETKLAETAAVLKTTSFELLKRIESIKYNPSAVAEIILKTRTDVEQLNPYEKIIADFKKSYSNYDDIEARANKQIQNIKSNRADSIVSNYASSNDINLFRAIILAVTKLSLEQDDLLPWPYKWTPARDVFKSILAISEDLTLIRAMHELSEINATIQIHLNYPFHSYFDSIKHYKIISDGPQVEIIKFLIEVYGADIAQTSITNENLIHLLGRVKRTDANSIPILEYIYQINPTLFNEKTTDEGMTPLFWFTTKELEWAISKRLNISIQNNDFTLVSYKLWKSKSFDTVKILIEAGADLTMVNPDSGDTAIDILKSFLRPYEKAPQRTPTILLEIKKLIQNKYKVELP